MDGHGACHVMAGPLTTAAGTGVMIHPGSCLFGNSDDIAWLLFHEIVWTSKVRGVRHSKLHMTVLQVFARTVCPVSYAWIKDLLPKLHEVDVWMLSGTGQVRPEGTLQFGCTGQPSATHRPPACAPWRPRKRPLRRRRASRAATRTARWPRPNCATSSASSARPSSLHAHVLHGDGGMKTSGARWTSQRARARTRPWTTGPWPPRAPAGNTHAPSLPWPSGAPDTNQHALHRAWQR